MAKDRRVLLVAAALLWITACGPGESSGTTAVDTEPTTSTSPEETTPTAIEEDTMQLTSAGFAEQGSIPVVYTCDGDDVSPPLRIDGVPPETVTLTLIVDDPDAPGGTWDHWVAFDITPAAEIPENVGDLGTAGNNSWGEPGYGGPCPPSGTHRYIFRVYALDTELGLPEGAIKAEVLAAMEGHILAEATLTGLYER